MHPRGPTETFAPQETRPKTHLSPYASVQAADSQNSLLVMGLAQHPSLANPVR